MPSNPTPAAPATMTGEQRRLLEIRRDHEAEIGSAHEDTAQFQQRKFLLEYIDSITAALAEREREVERLRAALTEVDECFQAAMAEGLIVRLSDQADISLGSLHDLFYRRLLHADHTAIAALATPPKQVTK